MPKKIPKHLFVFAAAGMTAVSATQTTSIYPQDRWVAPAWADTIRNPYHHEPLTLAQGEELFTLYCATCHGEGGYGDGAAGGALGQKPANFHDTLVTKQSDGALFWKLSKGNGNMPPFDDVFSAEQKWQLVAYIREFSKKK